MTRFPPESAVHRLPFFYGWVVLACATSANVARQVAAVAPLSVFILPMSTEFDWSRTSMSGAVSLGGLLGAFISPLLGRFVDRQGPRLVLVISTLVLGGACFALAGTGSLVAFYVAFAVGRMTFLGPMDIGITSVPAKWFLRFRARANSISALGHFIGLALMPLLAQAVISDYGWRMGWVALGVVVLVLGTLPVLLFVVGRPEDVGLLPDGEQPTADRPGEPAHLAGTAASREFSFTLQQALRTPTLWLLMAFSGLIFMVQAGMSLHQAPHLVERGISPGMAATIVSVFSLAAAGSAILMGFIGDRLPLRFSLFISASVMAASTVLMHGVSSPVDGFAAAALFGAGIGISSTLLPVVWANYYGREHYGAIRGVTLAVQVLGQATGPLIAGVLYDLTGSYYKPFAVFFLLCISCAVLAVFAARPARPRTDRRTAAPPSGTLESPPPLPMLQPLPLPPPVPAERTTAMRSPALISRATSVPGEAAQPALSRPTPPEITSESTRPEVSANGPEVSTSDVESVQKPAQGSIYPIVRLLTALALMTLGGSAMYASITVLGPVAEEFGGGRGGASLPYTVFMICFGLGGVIMGRLADRKGVLPPAIIGSLCLPLGLLAAAHAADMTQFLLALGVLCGLLGASFTFAPLVSDISHWFTGRRGLAVGVVVTGTYLAGAVWPPILQSLYDSQGWRATFVDLAMLTGLCMLPLTTLLLPKSPVQGGDGHTAGHDSKRPLGLSVNGLQCTLCAAGIGCCVAMSMPQVHIIPHAVDLGLPAARGAEMMSLMLGFGIVSRLGSGWLSDRIGGLRTLIIGSALQGIVLVAFMFADTLTALYITSAAFGLAQGGIVPSYAIIIRSFLPASESGWRIATALLFTIGGMALGGWMAGALYDSTGSYTVSYLNAIAFNVLNLAIAAALLMRAIARNQA